jgi:hypothetical protein
MPNTPGENRGDSTDRSHRWDYPDGLGWRLWRRAHSTGLLTQHIQRILVHFRRHTFMDAAPLAAEIRRRWGLGQDRTAHWFGADLPLFYGYTRFPLSYADTSYEQPTSTPQALHRSAAGASVILPSRRIDGSGGRGLLRITQPSLATQRSSTMARGSTWHWHDLPKVEHALRWPLLSQGAKSLGAAAVTASDNNGAESATPGQRTEGHRRSSEPLPSQPNVSLSDYSYTTLDSKMLPRTIAIMTHRRGGQDRPSISSQDMLVVPAPELTEHDIRYFPVHRRTKLLSAIGWHRNLPMQQPMQHTIPRIPRLAQTYAVKGAGEGSTPTELRHRSALRYGSLARCDHSPTMPPAPQRVAAMPVHWQVAALVQRRLNIPHPALPQVRIHPYDAGRLASALWTPMHPFTAPAAFTMRLPVGMRGRGGQMLLHSSGTLQERGLHGGNVVTNATWQAQANDLPTVWPLGRQFRPSDMGTDDVGYNSPAPIGQSWILPVQQFITSRWTSAFRQRDDHAPVLRRSNGYTDIGTVHSTAALEVGVSKRPGYSRATYVQRFNQPTGMITNLLPASRPMSSPEQGKAGMPAGMESLAPLALRTVHGFAVTRRRQVDKAGSSHTEGPGTEVALSGAGRGGARVTERHIALGIVLRRGLQRPTTLRPVSLDRGPSELQRFAGKPAAPLRLNAVGETRPLMPHGRLFIDQPSARRPSGLPDSDRVTTVGRRGRVFSSTSTTSPLGRLFYLGRTGLHHASYDSSMARHAWTVGKARPRFSAGPISLSPFALHSGQASIMTYGRRRSLGSLANDDEPPGLSWPITGGEAAGTVQGNDTIRMVPDNRPMLSRVQWHAGGLGGGYALFEGDVGQVATSPVVVPGGEMHTTPASRLLTASNVHDLVKPNDLVRPVWRQSLMTPPASTQGQAWSVTNASSPLLLRLHRQIHQGEQASTMMMRDAVRDMPLVPPFKTESQDGSPAHQRVNGLVVQSSPQAPASVSLGVASSRSGERAEAHKAATEASQPQVDLDELVERTWQKLLRKLTIEQERRGGRRWL